MPVGTHPPDAKESVAMNDALMPNAQGLVSPWLAMMSNVVWGQWRLLDAQYQAGLDFLKTLEGAPLTRPSPPSAGGEGRVRGAQERVPDLESQALERVRKGFPPPPEVYLAENRNRIDWSRFPEWAWPMDPELFTGTSHEG